MVAISVGRKPQAVPRLTKDQRLVQAIVERLFKLENSPQITVLYHAAFMPDAPPRKELERLGIAHDVDEQDTPDLKLDLLRGVSGHDHFGANEVTIFKVSKNHGLNG